MGSALLSRFDLVFILLDKPDAVSAVVFLLYLNLLMNPIKWIQINSSLIINEDTIQSLLACSMSFPFFLSFFFCSLIVFLSAHVLYWELLSVFLFLFLFETLTLFTGICLLFSEQDMDSMLSEHVISLHAGKNRYFVILGFKLDSLFIKFSTLTNHNAPNRFLFPDL